MNVLRKLILSAAAAVFFAGILGLAGTASVYRIFGTSENLKTSLSGEVYGALTDDITAQTTTVITRHTGLPDDSRIVGEAVKKAITPEAVKRTGTRIIDAAYIWLDGRNPVFAASDYTSDLRSRLSRGLGQAAADYTDRLPACNLEQMLNLNPDAADNPFLLTCRPPGLNTGDLRQQVEQSISREAERDGSDDILGDKLVFDRSARVSGALDTLQRLPWLLAGFSFAVAVCVLVFGRRQGMKYLSAASIAAGLLLIVLCLIIHPAASQLTGALESSAPISKATSAAIINAISGRIRQTLAVFAASYLILGLAGAVIPRFRQNRTGSR